MASRDRKAERREATRREILDAVWDVAREQGLAAMTLCDVAARVGMRPPSRHSHFASKNAVYDAMFGEAWGDYLEIVERTDPELPASPRAAIGGATERTPVLTPTTTACSSPTSPIGSIASRPTSSPST